MTQIEPSLLTRFAADLDALVEPDARVGVAVSGGPDSLALLLLTIAARPGQVEAATVDHGLRKESGAEAQMVAGLCERLDIPHAILTVDWDNPPTANIQAQAREVRYGVLGQWAVTRGQTAVATAHHADDQAETLLMRLGRGSGISGLAGIERCRALDNGVRLVRPLLGWRRDELRKIVDAAGLEPVDDPTNVDQRFDRTRARAALRDSDVLDAERLAASANHLADAEDALRWSAAQAFDARCVSDGAELTLDPRNLPRELQRRLLAAAIDRLTGKLPAGPDLIRALDALAAGGTTTLAGLKLVGGTIWRLSPAPKRRPTADSTHP
jgi:tRNA(Ile)-lysidine synthase